MTSDRPALGGSETGDTGSISLPETLSEYAIRMIRDGLISGTLAAGQRIVTVELARELGISHVPVREAIRFLEAQGHLRRVGRHTIEVPHLDPQELGQLYRLRSLLEAEANVASIPLLTNDDFRELEHQVAIMARAVDERDYIAMVRANRSFHFVGFSRCSQEWLLRFLHILWDAVARYQLHLFRLEGWPTGLQLHHEAILHAMKRRDATEVNRLVAEHRVTTLTSNAIDETPLALG